MVLNTPLAFGNALICLRKYLFKNHFLASHEKFGFCVVTFLKSPFQLCHIAMRAWKLREPPSCSPLNRKQSLYRLSCL
jgi:hypothetical protein